MLWSFLLDVRSLCFFFFFLKKGPRLKKMFVTLFEILPLIIVMFLQSHFLPHYQFDLHCKAADTRTSLILSACLLSHPLLSGCAETLPYCV